MITRQKLLQIVVTCEMEYNSTVEIMYITEDDIIQNQSVLGKYNTSLALYESDSFENLVQESPYYVDLNQTLFVQATLHTSDPSLVVFLDTCRASPTSDFASPTYDLISSGYVLVYFPADFFFLSLFLMCVCVMRERVNVHTCTCQARGRHQLSSSETL